MDPGELLSYADATPADQEAIAGRTIRCRSFNSPPVDVPLSKLRLILDTHITGVDHSETILEPLDRVQLAKHLRDFIDGCEAFGYQVRLSEAPVDARLFPGELVAPPPLWVRSRHGTKILPPLKEVTQNSLLERAKCRADHVRDFGFLESRPIVPLLACPPSLGAERAKRLKNDLNDLWAAQHLPYRFSRYEIYGSAEELRRYVEQGDYDAVLAVLPEGSRQRPHDRDTHERIKQTIGVPFPASQAVLQICFVLLRYTPPARGEQ